MAKYPGRVHFENHYVCDEQGRWTDVWACHCDDECPSCDGVDSPVRSDLASLAFEPLSERGITLEEARAEIAETIAAKRMGQPHEFGDACAFLCSAQAGYISGQNLQLDGGTYPGLI